MAIDLQKYIIAEVVSSKDLDLFLSLYKEWFSGPSETAYTALKDVHVRTGKVATPEELAVVNASCSKVTDWIAEYNDTEIDQSLVLSELENDFARNKVLDFVISTTSSIKDKSAEELTADLSDMQQSLTLGSAQTKDTVTDAIDAEYENDECELISSGFSDFYDEEAGGFAYGELIVVGGERGSGKSIITQNLTNHHYLEHRNTVAYFNIEMSKANVAKRFLAQIASVPYNDIRRRSLTTRQKITIESSKASFFYKPCSDIDRLITELSQEVIDFRQFTDGLKDLERNEHKYFNIDDASLTMEKLEQTIARLVGEHDLRFVNVDYINIIKDGGTKDQDWLIQQRKAERLKEIAKAYNIVLLTPYQIHSDGSAKRAKAIEDSVDRSFKFFPKINQETGLPESDIKVYQAKARDNEPFPFYVGMQWDYLKLRKEVSNSFEDKERAGTGAS